MKKLMAIVLVISMMFVSACGSDDETTETKEPQLPSIVNVTSKTENNSGPSYYTVEVEGCKFLITVGFQSTASSPIGECKTN